MYLRLSNLLAVFSILLLFVVNPIQAQLDYDIEEGSIVEEVDPQWVGSFAAGLNGKSGNSQSTDINSTLNLTRETDFATTAIVGSYFYSATNAGTVTDRAFGQWRQERKLANPKWSWFYQSAFEWDRFKAFDYRVALHTGLAYKVYDLDDRKFKLRMGAGASKEVGGLNDDWIPELQFGADWERKISETTRLYASCDYFPNIEDFSDYRINTNAGVDFLLDAERNINFRIFALNRFDSTPPAGNNQNDIDYGLALVVGF
jgi:putative salt-induced outer membrane protein YdiY